MIGLTGAFGFIGSAIFPLSEKYNSAICPLVRQATTADQTTVCPPRIIGDLGAGSIEPNILEGCTAVIHLAARAHRMGERGAESLVAYRQTNVAGTQALIQAMMLSGVRRLVYVSSIKALGEWSNGSPLTPHDQPAPEDAYGISKAEAELVVHKAQNAGHIDAVIIRPVLVYGPGAKGNLHRLMQAIWKRQPLPFGSVDNRRSMISVQNLADALFLAATSEIPTAVSSLETKGQRQNTYHIADDGAISTRRLIEVLAEGMERKANLFRMPRWLAVSSASMLGKGAMIRRLFGDLEVDDSDFRRDFSWKPRVSLEDGLRQMAADYARRQMDLRKA